MTRRGSRESRAAMAGARLAAFATLFAGVLMAGVLVAAVLLAGVLVPLGGAGGQASAAVAPGSDAGIVWGGPAVDSGGLAD
jgi:hypothetical protein